MVDYIPFRGYSLRLSNFEIYNFNEEIIIILASSSCNPFIPPRNIFRIFKGRYIGRRQKSSSFGKACHMREGGVQGLTTTFGKKKYNHFCFFSSFRSRSLQNVLKHIKTVKFMRSTLPRVVQKQAVKSTFYENTQ